MNHTLRHKIWNTLLYAGVEKEEYLQFLPDIQRKNTGHVWKYSQIMMCYYLFLYAYASFLYKELFHPIRVICLMTAVGMLLLALGARYVVKNEIDVNWVHILLNYLFMGLIYNEALLLVFCKPFNVISDTSLLVEMIVLPMIMMDKPIRMIGFDALFLSIFLVGINLFKDPALAAQRTMEDLLYIITSTLVIVFVSSIRIRENELKQKSEALEAEKKVNLALAAAQKEITEAREAAEEANRAKTNFLLNMSHDIRTPMNAIMGYSQLIKKGLTDPTLLHYQEEMEHASEFLLSLINNVLDMAKIENGNMDLDEEYHEAGKVIAGIINVYEVQAKKKNLEFTHQVNVEHTHIMCDRFKVQNIFTNLISNAVKYTTEGGRISIRTRELPSGQEGVIIIETVVEDTGIGMSKEYLPHLFEMFSRENSTTSGKVGGTGLGMPIVKQYVELMSGTIDVESELGKGSKFTVRLPHRIADEAYLARPDQKMIPPEELETRLSRLAGKRILLAEDNELNAEIAQTLLEDVGLVVDHVTDGILCVEKIEHSPAGTYDLILMDILMPNMDGYKAAEMIRHLEEPDKANIPIVAVTANAFAEDIRNALAAGMNGHLAKPIEIAKLMEVLVTTIQ